MRTYLECYPCFFKQALEAARLAGADEVGQKCVLDEVARALPEIPLETSPPEIARVIHGIIKRVTGKDDPYIAVKEKSNRLALGFLHRLKDRVSRSSDRLLMAVELAIAGNIIDYGVKNSLDVQAELERILDEENKSIKRENKAIFDFQEFKECLQESKTILYLGDNAGETVFDRILIEEIKRFDDTKKIIYAVKEKPVINDALREDAITCGIDKVAHIVSSGSDAPGTVLSICSEKFLKMFGKADMVISKGQGNFEALSGAERPVFYLFMAKCPVVANHIGCTVGDINLVYFQGKGK